MRVLMTTDTIGGVWMYSIDLARGLLEAGNEICLVSFGELPDANQERSVRELQQISPQRFRFLPTEWPLEWVSGDSRIEESSKYLAELIGSFGPDLLHSNQFCYGGINVRVPRVVVAHSDVISWWHARFGEEPSGNDWLDRYRSIVRAGLNGADVVVSPSRAQLRSLEQHFGSLGSRGRVIHNGSAPQVHGTDSRKLRAVTAGRLWDEGKNTAIVELARLPLPVYIAGRQRNSPEHVGVAEMQHEALVTLLGHLNRSALSKVLAESSIYLGTSLYEPFGLAPLEAAHAGCALVLSDIESFREIWGDAALYFHPRDPGSLHDAVVQLIEWPMVCKHLQQRAFDRARKLYPLDRFVHAYTDLYEQVCGQGVIAHVA
jgi:glycogen(starch) synthase